MIEATAIFVLLFLFLAGSAAVAMSLNHAFQQPTFKQQVKLEQPKTKPPKIKNGKVLAFKEKPYYSSSINKRNKKE